MFNQKMLLLPLVSKTMEIVQIRLPTHPKMMALGMSSLAKTKMVHKVWDRLLEQSKRAKCQRLRGTLRLA